MSLVLEKMRVDRKQTYHQDQNMDKSKGLILNYHSFHAREGRGAWLELKVRKLAMMVVPVRS